ncbi:hypothetical protein MO973_38585 [Paenibacillus sp. TRM 82003]|uniref:hypothetical protein n=1 Tax=Kineococcus sp. TRM81007 TaxID=2925831 RepID=UPI001F598BB6|nr:hypothetical protein [Kineococcus sp. TRM81007]MCI2239607.1 hypothetical protein [Kineococcus sp. TRM81007]MCI3926111.1 hypothetical protein [Paenibacillus sp. TRM 82003]
MTADETAEPTGTPVRGAQTVAPVQASALQFAASILGEASYTPQAELRGTLSAPSRVTEPVAAAPVEEPVAAAPVEEPVIAAPVEEPVAEQPKGWFGRLLAKLFGRG